MSRRLIIRLHNGLTVSLLIVAGLMIFKFAPIESETGNLYRLLYIHFPTSVIGLMAWLLIGSGNLMALKRPGLGSDFTVACSEVGLVFCLAGLLSGMLWARPIWGIWWTWDARLTSTACLCIVYLIYLAWQFGITTPENLPMGIRLTVASIGLLVALFNYMSVRWFRTQHPGPVFGDSAFSVSDPKILLTALISVAALTSLFASLLVLRMRSSRLKRDILTGTVELELLYFVNAEEQEGQTSVR